MITDKTKEDEVNALSDKLSSINISSDTPAATSSTKLAVLVVDDDKINHRIVTKLLKELSKNMLVTSVYSGKEAVESIQAGNKYDVILVDFEMGKGKWDGEETAEEIRKVDKDACIVTWSTLYKNKKYAHADRFLNKPVKPLELRALFEELKLLQEKPDPKSSTETNILSNASTSTQFGSSSLTNKPVTETPAAQSTPTMEKKP